MRLTIRPGVRGCTLNRSIALRGAYYRDGTAWDAIDADGAGDSPSPEDDYSADSDADSVWLDGAMAADASGAARGTGATRALIHPPAAKREYPAMKPPIAPDRTPPPAEVTNDSTRV